MQTAHIKLYVEMHDGMVIEHDTNKATNAYGLVAVRSTTSANWRTSKSGNRPKIGGRA